MSEKIKREILERLCELREVREGRDEIEEETELSYSDLMDDDEYACLCSREVDLMDEIEELMLETKYFPLFGLTHNDKKEFDFFELASNKALDRNFEKHMEYRLLQLQSGMKSRLKDIKTLRLDRNITSYTYYLYGQVIRIYVGGYFEAVCAMCRTTAEYIAKEYIKQKKKSYYLSSDYRKKGWYISKILIEVLNVTNDIVTRYDNISKIAAEGLHKGKKVHRKDALSCIENLQYFVLKFPKGSR